MEILRKGKPPVPPVPPPGSLWEGACGKCGCKVRAEGAEVAMHRLDMTRTWFGFVVCPTADCHGRIILECVNPDLWRPED
jgi:hypothetical protein